ncbi:DMT family transporter [Nocardioides sp. CFH 31398]|uniref:DMT family transporter n=1 Tax=Nocardioides sp. CFH 31398 TaxID=2919579 RepID=UPI001F064D49|nr:EamA family transporter [Nocardioides sp. CFH 31398]MCH1866724.1 EamA family transporter [Nocardioides sp. CFH 31398]
MTAPPRAASGLLLVCAAGVVWGTIGPAVAIVGDRTSLSVLMMGAYRSVAAVLVMVAVVAVGRHWTTCRRLLAEAGGRAVLVGLLTAAFQMLFFVAVLATGVSVATVVAMGIPPVLLLVLHAARDRRPPSVPQLLTVATALTGLLLVTLVGGGHAPGGETTVAGVLIALASGSAYALSAEFGGPLTKTYGAVPTATATLSVVCAALVPLGVVAALVLDQPLTTSDPVAWSLLVYLGVVTMALAYVLLFAGLRTTSSGNAVLATLLEPVTAVLIAVAFLGEALTLPGVVGSALVLLAIASLGRQLEEPEPK